MKKFIVETGIIMPLNRANVDTDAIIPKQFLRSIKRTGFGVNLFDEWRYVEGWDPSKDSSERKVNPEFVLNQPQYKDATILLARVNFGCGSSREHAVWALDDYGFRAIIAPSYSDIFYNNCFKSGVLPIRLREDEVDEIFQIVEEKAISVTIDLPKQEVKIGTHTYQFDIDSFRKERMLKGLDDIGQTLEYSESIKAFEEQYKKDCPWIFEDIKI